MTERSLKEQDEKTDERDEFWKSDRLDTIGWAAAFIWGGLVLLVGSAGFVDNIGWWDGWSVFFTGAGVLVLFGTLFRAVVPEYHRKVLASLIFGLLLIGIGLGNFWVLIWPLALIIVGFVILRSAFAHRS